jgi:hypothetical protein
MGGGSSFEGKRTRQGGVGAEEDEEEEEEGGGRTKKAMTTREETKAKRARTRVPLPIFHAGKICRHNCARHRIFDDLFLKQSIFTLCSFFSLDFCCEYVEFFIIYFDIDEILKYVEIFLLLILFEIKI